LEYLLTRRPAKRLTFSQINRQIERVFKIVFQSDKIEEIYAIFVAVFYKNIQVTIGAFSTTKTGAVQGQRFDSVLLAKSGHFCPKTLSDGFDRIRHGRDDQCKNHLV
jgi:hypothetical protein